MTRPTDDAAFEAKLAALVPAAPSPDLRWRVAEALAGRPAVRPAGGWLAERLLWACGGAAAGVLAASLGFAPVVDPPVRSPIAAPGSAVPMTPPATAATAPAVDVAEEAVAWDDAGVQFLDDRTPARILRRVAVERHRPAGGAEYHVPREDVILVPVALR